MGLLSTYKRSSEKRERIAKNNVNVVGSRIICSRIVGLSCNYKVFRAVFDAVLCYANQIRSIVIGVRRK